MSLHSRQGFDIVEQPRHTIQSVDRAARILKALAAGRLGVSEIADRLELARPTVHGLLRTLQVHGLVEQDADSGKYQLGPSLLHLGGSYLDVSDVRRRSIVPAERLAQATRSPVRVGVPHGAEVLVVHHVFQPGGGFQVLEVGAQLPPHATALGKALLSLAPEDVLAALRLPKLTGRTLGPEKLREQLEAARRNGYAVERAEAVLGEGSIAAPVVDATGRPVAAIGVTGQVDRLFTSGRPDRAAVAAVLESAAAISRDLGAARTPLA